MDGNLVDTSNQSPLVCARQYDVFFPDGTYVDYSANVLLENLYSQVDKFGSTETVLKEMLNHCISDAVVSKENSLIQLDNGVKRRVITKK